nr:sigma-70 family RNA polymerase sigma factor [bacterium]
GARSKLQSEGVEKPTARMSGEGLEIPAREVGRSMALNGGEGGLDDQGTGGRPLSEPLASDTQPGSDRRLYDRVMREDVRRSLQALTDREAMIISLYYGLSSDEALTLEAIGKRLGLTRERIRQIKEKALRKMRQTAGRALLKDYS